MTILSELLCSNSILPRNRYYGYSFLKTDYCNFILQCAEFLEYKSEIEKEREKVVQQRLAFEAGVETRTDSDSVEGKIQNFLLQKMDFTEHYVDRDIISQFVDTVIPRSETCYEWYMDFDLIEKPNEKKKMVWSFKIDYNEAKTYRKEREGMLRPNQWEDLIVRVYI